MAPNFDNNLSLLSVVPDEKVKTRKIGLFESTFEDFCQETNAVQNYNHPLPKMAWEQLRDVVTDLLSEFADIALVKGNFHITIVDISYRLLCRSSQSGRFHSSDEQQDGLLSTPADLHLSFHPSDCYLRSD